jgi:hypothetical protein
MGRVHGKDDDETVNAQKIFTGKPEARRTIADVGVDWGGGGIYKWVLKKYDVRQWAGFK